MACQREGGGGGSNLRQPAKPQANKPFMHFFKIILSSTLQDKKLRIPDKFARKFGDELSDFATLVVPNGHSWQLRLTKDDSNIWFDNGWQEFVEHHFISYGYFLVFGYRGASNFSVLIFDMSACEIQYPCVGPNTGQGEKFQLQHENEMEMEDDDSIEILGSAIPYPFRSVKTGAFDVSTSKWQSRKHDRHVHFQEDPNFEQVIETRSKKCMKQKRHKITELDDANESRRGKLNKHGISNSFAAFSTEAVDRSKSKTKFDDSMSLSKCEDDNDVFSSGFGKASQARQRAICAARLIKTKNPSFIILMRPYVFVHNYVNLPVRFIRTYLNGIPESIKLQASDGREWPVRITDKKAGNKRRRFVLMKGWKIFSSENNLEVGDVCVFEIIKNNNILKDNKTFQVSIIRAS